jgi:hypothetical protein
MSAPIIEKDTYGLVDSSYEGYVFIDRDYIKQAGLLLVLVDRLFLLYGYDGEDKNSRIIREYVRYSLKSGDYIDKDAVLYTILLPYYPIILGYL